MRTIFDSIVRNENDYTNLLRNLLERQPKFAAASLNSLLHEFDRHVDDGEAAELTFRTQPRFITEDRLAVPDLIVEGKDLYCVVEIKVTLDRDVTPSQMGGYSECFGSGKHEYLVFLFPAGSKHELAIRTIKAKSNTNEIPTAAKHWHILLKDVSDTAASIDDDVLEEGVKFLTESFELYEMENSELIILKNDWKSSFTAVRKLQLTLDQTSKIFRLHDYKTEPEGHAISSYGFYVKHEGKYRLWVGLWTDTEEPLCYGYELRKSIWDRPSLAPAGGTITKDGTHRLWSISSDNYAEPHKIFEEIKGFLQTGWSE